MKSARCSMSVVSFYRCGSGGGEVALNKEALKCFDLVILITKTLNMLCIHFGLNLQTDTKFKRNHI